VRVNDKLLHAGSYLVLMVWFVGLYRQRWHLPIALMLFLIGVGVELPAEQIADPALRSHGDMVANGAGIVIGLILGALWLTGWCQRAEKAAQGLIARLTRRCFFRLRDCLPLPPHAGYHDS
jgi:hypothetical protein